MKFTPHLSFNGRCEEAFRFYARSTGGKIVTMMTWGESPMAAQVPPELADKIIHATLAVGDAVIAGADVPSGQYQKPAGVAIVIALTDPAEGERVFNALAEKGTVQMPFEKTFWSPGFGMLKDQFGISWEINCETSAG